LRFMGDVRGRQGFHDLLKVRSIGNIQSRLDRAWGVFIIVDVDTVIANNVIGIFTLRHRLISTYISVYGSGGPPAMPHSSCHGTGTHGIATGKYIGLMLHTKRGLHFNNAFVVHDGFHTLFIDDLPDSRDNMLHFEHGFRAFESHPLLSTFDVRQLFHMHQFNTHHSFTT